MHTCACVRAAWYFATASEQDGLVPPQPANKSVRLLTFRLSSRIWAELHERAFRRLKGAPRVVVLDNLRRGCSSPTSSLKQGIRC